MSTGWHGFRAVGAVTTCLNAPFGFNNLTPGRPNTILYRDCQADLGKVTPARGTDVG